jgi:saccharopine dehydrogenase (NAD+, L-lysine-forming)
MSVQPTQPESAAGTSAETQPRQPIWLRCEKKPHEHRSALTPTTARTLMDNNFEVFVERDPQRIFDDKEFEEWVFSTAPLESGRWES